LFPSFSAESCLSLRDPESIIVGIRTLKRDRKKQETCRNKKRNEKKSRERNRREGEQ
jgi:hypothetical protein